MEKNKNVDLNPNDYIRKWRVKYWKNKWPKGDYEEMQIECSFRELLKKLENIMDFDIYTNIIIEEED